VIKVLIALAGIGVVLFLFIRSANDARSEPYAVSASHLRNWTLGIDTAADADGAMVSLRPPPELPMNLFRQLFSRQMESMGTPSQPGIPLVLRREVPGEVTAEEVLALARAAGFEQATLAPKCVGYRRVSDPGITRQLYFMWFDVPGFDRFRRALAPRAAPGFDPRGLSPVLMMAAQPNFAGWLPITVDQPRDCVAPLKVE
jgi:hypothetical protein